MRHGNQILMRRCLLLYLVLLPYAASAQDLSKVHFVRAGGEATIQTKPDRVQISIGVTTQAATAQAAAAQNALQSSAVLDSLKGIVEGRGESKTTGYNVTPQYAYAPNQPPRVKGYEATNTVLVTLDDLSQTGKLLDAASGSGANNVSSISFTLRDSSPVYAQVLAEAATKARANAEAIAKALGVRVTGVLSAEPQEITPVRPIPMAQMAMAREKTETPIEAGNLDVHASVIVTLEVQ